MKAVTATEQLIKNVMCEFETAKAEEKTLYAAVSHAAAAFGQNPDALPEDLMDVAYKAITEMAKERLTGLCREGVKLVDEAMAAVKALPESPTARQIKEAQKKIEQAELPFAFMGAVVKAMTDDMDYEYLAEQMLEAGRAAEKKEKEPVA